MRKIGGAAEAQAGGIAYGSAGAGLPLMQTLCPCLLATFALSQARPSPYLLPTHSSPRPALPRPHYLHTGGDVKGSAKVEPYAYWPLDRRLMNRRQQKSKGAKKGLDKIVAAAKEGAAKGQKAKRQRQQ